MIRIAATIALLPSVALAHGGPAGHAHPHGLEALALVGAAGLGILILRKVLK